MRLKPNMELNIKSHMKINMTKKYSSILFLSVLITISLCSCRTPNAENKIDEINVDGIVDTIPSTGASLTTQLIENTSTISISSVHNRDAFENITDILSQNYYYGLFYDIDLDNNNELILVDSDDRSFSTNIYTIYKLNNEIPELYGRIKLESDQSKYSGHTICEGKLQRYYDHEKNAYIIISDATKWDDGSFGNLYYSVIENTLYSDKIVNESVEDFSGTPCIPAQYIRENKATDYSYIDEWDFVYFNDILDLNSTEKFVDISDYIENLEFVDAIDLNSLPRYQDIDEIAEHILEYSGYENTNEVLAPDDDNEYIGIVGMGNHKIRKSDKDISIEISETTDMEWDKILEINDLHSLVLHYYGDEAMDIDLLSLKKYQNLTSISLPENISESTKLQISELTTLEYVNKCSIIISNEKDFAYLKNLPNLKYIAVSSDNDDPDYFKFLYENQSIEWIRFDESVTDEQIKQIVDNMPNLKAVTFGFSEV